MPKTIDVDGFTAYAVEDAPEGQWLVGYFRDHVIAIAFKTEEGQWHRGRGGAPVMGPAAPPLGWVPVR